MKIVILDGYTVNPGDLSWNTLKKFGEVICFDRTPQEKVIERIGDAEILLTNKNKITSDIMDACPNLKYIGELATGYDNIDIKSAKERGIAVTNIPGYSTPDVAEFVFSFIFHYYNNVALQSESVLKGDWIASKDFSYYPIQRKELFGQTIGIIGFGATGQAIAMAACAFGMKIMVNTRNTNDKPVFKGMSFASLDEIYEKADIITLHCPLNDSTKGLINMTALKKMKKDALLINASRGPVVVEEDLAKALHNGGIAHACIDVLCHEPMLEGNPLLNAPNITITPHVAWATDKSRQRIIEIQEENLNAFINNKVKNRIEYR